MYKLMNHSSDIENDGKIDKCKKKELKMKEMKRIIMLLSPFYIIFT
jgi:hypothetical protein